MEEYYDEEEDIAIYLGSFGALLGVVIASVSICYFLDLIPEEVNVDENVNADDKMIVYNNQYLRTGNVKEFDSFEHIVCVDEKEMNNYEGYDVSFEYNDKTMIVNTSPVVVTEYKDTNGNIEYPYPGRIKELKEINQKTKKLSA